MEIFKSALTLVVFCILCVEGFEQELCLHETEGHNGNYQCFKGGVPDATIYALTKVKSICLKGVWLFYNATNYTSYEHTRRGSGLNDAQSCMFLRDPIDSVKSFRHLGPNNVEHWKENIVLYTGSHWVGREYVITSQSFGDIRDPILSLVSTGQANWTLFQGKHFDGKSVCWESAPSLSSKEAAGTEMAFVYNKNFHFTHNIMETNELETIGSVSKGCATPSA